MSETSQNDKLLIDAMNRRVERRSERRDFFKTAGAFTAGAAGMAALSACGGGGSNSVATSPAVAQSATVSDSDILNFALNLEYLEAAFYLTAVGMPISFAMTGTGTQGAINTAGAQAVPFSNAAVGAYAKEIAQDELNHVNFLRGALGGAAVATPAIDISATPTGSFSTAAQAAGLVPAGTAFSPYTSDVAFLLGAFIFEDVGVTAYHGAATLITNKMYLDAAAGILAVEAYHAGIVRTSLFAMGVANPPVQVTPTVNTAQATNAIANLRDSLDGSSPIIYSGGTVAVNDRGVGSLAAPTLVPVDSNSIAFDRNTGQVLNVVYGTKAAATKGLFFPNGTNGIINTSNANA